MISDSLRGKATLKSMILLFCFCFTPAAEEYVFCGDEKGSVWMYDLSNHLSALSAAKEDSSTKRIGPSQVCRSFCVFLWSVLGCHACLLLNYQAT